MKLKYHFDGKSLKFKLWLYFTFFTVVIMLMLWLLQIFFMQTFYQTMKSRELYRTVENIKASYAENRLYEAVIEAGYSSDMYIQVESGNDILVTSGTTSPRMPVYGSRKDIAILKYFVNQSETHEYITTISMEPSHQLTMIYAGLLDHTEKNQTYLLVFSPLYPVDSTVNILANQLIIVTLVSIAFGMIMSLVISRRLTRPLEKITSSAAKLAEGNYDIHFEGGSFLEIKRLANTLNYATKELSKSNALQRDLLANVSHDLKTPLTMVKSYAEMIRDLSGDNPDKRNQHLQVIIDESDRLNDLVNDLTSLSKMQSGIDAVVFQEFDLVSLAAHTLQSFSLYTEKDGFLLTLESPQQAMVVGDENKIAQVFSNLIGNAVRYSSENKTVTVRISDTEDGNMVKCQIIDTGQGISPDKIERIWDRYYQSSSNTSRTGRGSGLGLSIVKQIFILHDCQYGVISREGQGSNFWFTLNKPAPPAPEKPSKLSRRTGVVPLNGSSRPSDE